MAYLSGWTKRVPVTVAASIVDEAIPFFVIYLSDMPAEFWTAMSAASDTTGASLRVTTDDGETECAIYVPSTIDTGAETGIVFARGTGMSASVDTDYYLYVGNGSASMYAVTDTYGRNAVFADSEALYLPGMSTTDMTGGGATLTAVGTPTTTAAYEGVVAATYNGSSQYHHSTISYTGSTLSQYALVYGGVDGGDSCYLALTNSASNSVNWASPYLRAGLTNNPIVATILGATGGVSAATAANWDFAAWQLCGMTRTAATGTTTAYLDGTSATNSTTIVDPVFNRLAIGAMFRNTASLHFGGSVALAVFDTAVRSTDYLATMFKAFSDASFYSVGTFEEDATTVTGSTGWVVFQTAATTSADANDADWANVNDALVDDANAATATVDEITVTETESLKLTNINYGTSIPAGADRYTVSVRIKRSRDSGGGKDITDLVLQLINASGSVVGNNLADTVTNWPTSNTQKEYTGDETVWGLTLDNTFWDADSGISFRADGQTTNGNTICSVYYAEIKIDWFFGVPGAFFRMF